MVVNSDLEFTAIHEKLHNVYYVAEDGGVITGKEHEVRSENETSTGSSQEPNEGYRFLNWKVDSDITLKDGTTITAGSIVTMEDMENAIVDHDITFTAHYEKIPKLVVEKIADKEKYGVDEDILYTITLNQTVENAVAKNVVITDTLPDGVEIVSELTVTADITDMITDVQFNEKSFTVKVKELADANKITISFTAKANKEVVVTPEVLNTVGVEASNAESVEDEVVVARVVNIFTKITNGTIDEDLIDTPVGTTVARTYTPNEGYYIKEIRVNGVPVNVEDHPASYVFEDVTDDQDIEVICEKISYEITTEVKNGTIDSGGKVFVGDDSTITYEPQKGYKLKSIEVDGVEVDINEFASSYSFLDIQENHHIKVVYEPIPVEPEPLPDPVDPETYTVTFVDGYGATLKVQDGIPLHGSAIAPENPVHDGMTFKGWDIAFDDITKNITVTAQWEPLPTEVTYKVTTEVENGTIDPSVVVKKGDDVTIKFSPKDGYKLSKVIIDGKEIELKGDEKEYTFKALDKDHTIKVVYDKPAVPTPSTQVPVKTGDTSSIMGWMVILVLSTLAVVKLKRL